MSADCDDAISCLKAPLQAVGWRKDMVDGLEILVKNTHYLTTHAYQLVRWIFVFELVRTDYAFDPGLYMEKTFFYYIFMSLVNFKHPKSDDPEEPTEPNDPKEPKPKKAKTSKATASTTPSPVAKLPPPILPSHAKAQKGDIMQLIEYYLNDYCMSAQYAKKDYSTMSRVADYVGGEMATAYKVNIKLRYGERLRYAVNSILNTRLKASEIRERMEKEGRSNREIHAECERVVWAPAREVKEAIGLGVPVVHKLDEDGNPEVDKYGNLIVDKGKVRVFNMLGPVLQCYDGDYSFDKDNIYYDIKTHPAKHLRAFSKLCQIIEDNSSGIHKKKGRNKKANLVQCFPLRTTFVPCHMTIDSTILYSRFLKKVQGVTSTSPPEDIWSNIVNLKSKLFKKRRGLTFGHSVKTDGVAISLTFKTEAVRQAKLKSAAKGAATKKANQAAAAVAAAAAASGKAADVDSASDGVTAANDGAVSDFVAGNVAVANDAGTDFTAVAADIAADVGTSAATRVSTHVATGTKKNGHKNATGADCRYVHQLTRSELKEYMPQAIVDDMGRGDLHFLMSMDSTSLNRQILRYTRMQRLNETRSWRFRKIREKVKKAYPDDAINKAEQRLKGYNPCTMDPAKFKAYVEARAREWDLLSNFYADTQTSRKNAKHPGRKHSGREKREVALHRKLNLSAYLNKQQSEERLMFNIKKKFSDKRVLVMGNWSASMTKFHEPIRGKSWRDLFKRHGFHVFLIDEFRTSLICPTCDADLEKFHRVKNPRPYMVKKYPTVLCNGLLRCTNQKCLQADEKYKDTSKPRLYNRNVAAVVNFQRIINSLKDTGDIPEQFKRSTSRESAAKKSGSANKGKSSEPVDTMFLSRHSASKTSKKSLSRRKQASYNRTRKHFVKVLSSSVA